MQCSRPSSAPEHCTLPSSTGRDALLKRPPPMGIAPKSDGEREREREREGEIERQTDRQTYRQREREINKNRSKSEKAM